MTKRVSERPVKLLLSSSKPIVAIVRPARYSTCRLVEVFAYQVSLANNSGILWPGMIWLVRVDALTSTTHRSRLYPHLQPLEALYRRLRNTNSTHWIHRGNGKFKPVSSTGLVRSNEAVTLDSSVASAAIRDHADMKQNQTSFSHVE